MPLHCPSLHGMIWLLVQLVVIHGFYMLIMLFNDLQDRIIRPQDESMTFTEPPQDDGELYSHLQQAHYNQLDRKELSTTHLQDAG